MTDSPASVEKTTVPDFIDRKLRLRIASILCLLVAVFCFFCVLSTALQPFLSMLAQSKMPAPTWKMVVPNVLLFSFLMVFFVVVGVGSFLLKRWARNLMLVVSWGWLVIGAMTMVLMCFFVTSIQKAMETAGRMNGNDLPPGIASLTIVFMFIGMGLAYILFPLVLIWLYRGRDAELTCAHYDPHEGWTDHCPLPVLGLSLTLFGGVSFPIMMLPYNCMVPLFGTMITGGAGLAILAAISLVLLWLTYATYKRQHWSWYASLVLPCIWFGSTVVTVHRIGWEAYMSYMEMPKQFLQIQRQMGLIDNNFMIWCALAGVAVWVGYHIYIRRYFVRPEVVEE